MQSTGEGGRQSSHLVHHDAITVCISFEAPTIAGVIREIPRQIEGVDAVEVLVVDDGSRDATVQEALRAGADYVISNRLNRGLAATFKAALAEAVARGADIIVNTDADNHYDQSRIAELVAPLLHLAAQAVQPGLQGGQGAALESRAARQARTHKHYNIKHHKPTVIHPAFPASRQAGLQF